MTRGKGIYDDEDDSEASAKTRSEDPDRIEEKTPDVDSGSGEPTA
ncbi:hypothetical protein [Mycobacterium sp. SMC-4]